jgi:REP element-mobilizing transposase RayT
MNRRHTQLSFPDKDFKRVAEHGGSLQQGKRKERRPLSEKRPLHVVLRAEGAKGEKSFLTKRNSRYIQEQLKKLAEKYAVTVYSQSLNGNHIHLGIRMKNRGLFQTFLRIFSGKIAQFITGAKKGSPNKERFFSDAIYTRIVEWGKAFRQLESYITQNVLEAAGIIPYQPRKGRYGAQLPALKL